MINFDRLDKLTEEGYLRKVENGNLVLYNYTVKTVYDKYWNKDTINARGTVYDITSGDVVAQAFPKFFNFSELPVSKARSLLKKKDFVVYEKADGVLGIVYFYDGSWHVNTRGSFSSEFAIKAEQDILPKYDLSKLDKDITLLVEIIYPGSRIIVDYGGIEKLILIGAYNRKTGEDIYIYSNKIDCDLPRTPVVKFKSVDDIIDMQENMPEATEAEGFVVRFSDGYRVKFKSLEYLRVARIMKDISPKSIWKSAEGTLVVPKDLLIAIPEEFRTEVDEMVYDLQMKFSEIATEILLDIVMITENVGHMENTPEYRKKLGLYLKTDNELNHKSIMFPILLEDNEAVTNYIWKKSKPTKEVS